MANIKQGQQMIPFITCEILLCQDVCELVFGVDVFDLDLGVQINSIEQPNQEQLDEFGKHVSLLDFCLSKSF